MADNQKYYYLKLKTDFFESDAMIVLETMPEGYKYSNILLKMYLRSLKDGGKLMLNERIPYSSSTLAQVTRHSVGDVEKAVRLFRELGIIEVMDNNAIFMADIQDYIGKSTTEADRKRSYRQRIANEQLALNGQMSGQTSDNRTPEIEIEIKKEIEKEKTDEITDFFESVWLLYPLRNGKTSISKTTKNKLFKVGKEKLLKAIENYKDDLSINDWKKPMNGSTFFNGRYEDYLDGNYTTNQRSSEPPTKKYKVLE